MDLPDNITYGKVIGKFLIVSSDTDDLDRFPDGSPASGVITFTPSIDRLLNTLADPPVTILVHPVECQLDETGTIIDSEGNEGIYLVATDNEYVNPLDWTYTVAVTLTNAPEYSYSISVPGDSTIDLSVVTPVPGANGTYYLRGDKGDKGDDSTVPGPPGVVQSVEEGTGISVDSTAPDAPVVSIASAVLSDISSALGHSALTTEAHGGIVASDDARLSDARTPTAHTHDESDITGLATSLSGKANTAHTHAESDITGLATSLSGKANTSHSHAESDITGLATSLSGKANTSHTHAISNITDLSTQLGSKVASDDARLSDARTPTAHSHDISDVTDLLDELSAADKVWVWDDVEEEYVLTGGRTFFGPVDPDDEGFTLAVGDKWIEL